MADTKLPALTEISLPVLDDVTYVVDVSDTTDDASGSSRKATLSRLGGVMSPFPCQGRLTLESGVPVSSSDQTAKTTVYFTPMNGNVVSLYDGTRWRLYTFTERSLALGTLTSDKNYDIFLYDNSGTLTLELSAAWTTDSARADALASQDGVMVKSGATTRRHIGTIRTTTTTTTEDSKLKRFVWNRYNQRHREIVVQETTDSWSYSTAAWRAMNNSTANRVQFVCGEQSVVVASCRGQCNNNLSTSRNIAVGIGVDSTSANSCQWFGQSVISFAPAVIGQMVTTVAAGFHFLQLLEYGGGADTQTWYGDAGLAQLQTGLVSQIEN